MNVEQREMLAYRLNSSFDRLLFTAPRCLFLMASNVGIYSLITGPQTGRGVKRIENRTITTPNSHHGNHGRFAHSFVTAHNRFAYCFFSYSNPPNDQQTDAQRPQGGKSDRLEQVPPTRIIVPLIGNIVRNILLAGSSRAF